MTNDAFAANTQQQPAAQPDSTAAANSAPAGTASFPTTSTAPSQLQPQQATTAFQPFIASPAPFAVAGFVAAGAALSPGSLIGSAGVPASSSDGSGFNTGPGVFNSGTSNARAVDRILATALPDTSQYGFGFRGRLLFPNSNTDERSATIPGPMEQPQRLLLNGGGDTPQPPDVTATAARPGRTVAVDGDTSPDADTPSEPMTDSEAAVINLVDQPTAR